MKRRDEEELKVSHWFTGATSEQVARRGEIWTLLGWYHRKVVEPQLGVRGILRRWWWRLTEQTGKLSPWREIKERVDAVKAHRALLHGIEAHRDAAPEKPPLIIAGR